MTANESSTEILRGEILADAQKKGEDIVIRARRDAETLLINANAEADQIRQEKLDHAREEAAHKRELILATVPLETGRMRSARIEMLLNSVFTEANRQLLERKGFEYRDTILALASQAITQMAGNAFVARISEVDHDIMGANLADEITVRVGRNVNVTILYEPDIKGGGVIVEDADARQVWDNRLTKKLERLWPELRRQIAEQVNFVPAHINVGEVK
jgi:vacuolar-type H+-ATPase subunit E/Vma4